MTEQQKNFLIAIQPTKDMVVKWPKWKREALGPVRTGPNFPPIKKEKYEKIKKNT